MQQIVMKIYREFHSTWRVDCKWWNCNRCKGIRLGVCRLCCTSVSNSFYRFIYFRLYRFIYLIY